MSSSIPQHIAIIMDGNRRWARQNKLQVFKGHERVAQENIERLTDHCIKLGIPYLTLWAFSTENWKRDKLEVEAILSLMRSMFAKGFGPMIKKKVKIETIGDLSKFPTDIQESIQKLKDGCVEDYKITVTFALNYGGRDEIGRAVEKFVEHEPAAKSAEVEAKLGTYLDTSFLPDPDLIIRTGGEQRLSGFMPWQSVYAELYFSEILMPDFNENELDEALAEYKRRERRFGG
ncbi:MAG: undecaprenyl diphosphate synthase [Microgenomates bacterium 39_7]|nr:MAG: undecaprenyl diphosphate synthase [Microgenomates bacterium 39_7]